MPEETESWLSVDGHRIVNFCGDTMFDAVSEEFFSILCVHHIEVINNLPLTSAVWDSNPMNCLQAFIQISRITDPSASDLVRLWQYPISYNCLKSI